MGDTTAGFALVSRRPRRQRRVPPPCETQL
jgi:hypothetical protein